MSSLLSGLRCQFAVLCVSRLHQYWLEAVGLSDLQQAERRSEADEVTCSAEPAGQPLPSPEVRGHPRTDPLYLEEGKDHAEEEMRSPGGLR